MKKTVTDNLTIFDNTLMKKIIFLSAFLFSIEFVADEEAEKISAFEKSVNDAIAQLKLGGNKNSIEKSNEGPPNCPPEPNEKWNDCLGTYTFANGDQYIGGFKDNRRNGQGTYKFANGDTYVGEFKDDKYHGQGTLTYASGKKEVGYYINDEYVPDICESMGLIKGTESFGGCVLKLIDDL